ncbi:unnamed protein product [Auanema sp. JU1783]|nr:unnamed protein product [Auanema sp. JU1783]
MVACAAVSSQSHVLLAVPMTTCALSVDQLKQQLLAAIENVNYENVCDVLSELEKAPITKEILESTRVGATINDVRKRFLEKWPDVSQRCRSLIKHWKKLVEQVRSGSSCTSSANATPNLVSPGAARLQRKVTPATPVNKRVTSTGLSNGRSTTVSPANGSYAPKVLNSPNGGLHKSQSVGAELLSKGEDGRNGKRKLEDGGPALKRVKTTASGLSNSTGTSSVSAARRATQSTTELVAQLSQNLPEHMSIDSSIREHEEKVKREQHDEEQQIVSPSVVVGVQEKKKRKYERRQKSEVSNSASSTPAPEERKGGLILRLPRIAPIREQEPSASRVETASTEDSRPTSSMSSSAEETSSESKKQIDWMSLVPSLESLMKKVEDAKAKDATVTMDPTKVHRVTVNERKLVALPYLDLQAKPDFLTYRYPDSAQYYANENFRYGAERESVILN